MCDMPGIGIKPCVACTRIDNVPTTITITSPKGMRFIILVPFHIDWANNFNQTLDKVPKK